MLSTRTKSGQRLLIFAAIMALVAISLPPASLLRIIPPGDSVEPFTSALLLALFLGLTGLPQ